MSELIKQNWIAACLQATKFPPIQPRPSSLLTGTTRARSCGPLFEEEHATRFVPETMLESRRRSKIDLVIDWMVSSGRKGFEGHTKGFSPCRRILFGRIMSTSVALVVVSQNVSGTDGPGSESDETDRALNCYTSVGVHWYAS